MKSIDDNKLAKLATITVTAEAEALERLAEQIEAAQKTINTILED